MIVQGRGQVSQLTGCCLNAVWPAGQLEFGPKVVSEFAPESLRQHFGFCVCHLASGGRDFRCAQADAAYGGRSGDDGASRESVCNVVVQLNNGTQETFSVCLNSHTDI